jgi:Na+:H+ antiporter, NhaA family
MVVPALIYTYFNSGDPVAMKGWAIPAATDIAFFYTENISLIALIIATCCNLILVFLNRANVESKGIYIFIGVIMWVAFLKSGVHATLTGIILAMFIPINSKINPDYSPLKTMENDLHSVVVFFILPIFGFANAGISFQGVGMEQLFHDVPLGIALGLTVGKQVGIFGLCWLAIKLNFSSLPKGMSWFSQYGTAALCGIGFTMSLFISSLAFEETGVNLLFDERLGIIVGSVVSGLIGYIVLKTSLSSKSRMQFS